MTYTGYGTDISTMTREDIEHEIERNQDFFNDCADSGQGVSSKEVVRQRALIAALDMDTTTALDIVDDYKTRRGQRGTLEALMLMQNDRYLSAKELAAREVAFAGFHALLAPLPTIK